jgi:hypothetical protein
MRIPIVQWWRRLNRLPEAPNQDWRDHFMLAGIVEDELVLMQTVERRFFHEPFDDVWCAEYRHKSPAATQAPPPDRARADIPEGGARIIPFAPVERGRGRKPDARLPPRDVAALRRSLDVSGPKSEDAEPSFRPSA